MITARRVAVAARLLLRIYIALVFWIVFSPDDESRATGLAALVFEIVDTLKVAVPTAFVALEFLANVVMFVPFGVLVWLAFARPQWWIVVGLGFATTVMIELVQQMLPGRFSTVSDVIANTLGAAVGMVVVRALAERAITRRG